MKDFGLPWKLKQDCNNAIDIFDRNDKFICSVFDQDINEITEDIDKIIKEFEERAKFIIKCVNSFSKKRKIRRKKNEKKN